MSYPGQDPALVDEDAPEPISVPDSGEAGEGGKLKMIVQLVKKCLGVKDIATMRLSLPASLLEPIPNLEYWQYLDRPDIFAAINDSTDPFERMLAVIRFAFSKDLKFVHGKLCKPYNSVLGEHFRAHWDVPPLIYPNDLTQPPIAQIYTSAPAPVSSLDPLPSDSASIKSARSSKSTRSAFSMLSRAKTPSTAATSPQPSLSTGNVAAQLSNLSLNSPVTPIANGVGDGVTGSNPLRVVYVTEQVSHHPPVSAYFASCPQRDLEMMGIDQVAIKVSGTTLRVAPGEFNQGIFVNITGGFGEGEKYHLTHPIAMVNGIFRGSFYATVSESTIITCDGGKPGRKFRTILEYKEESWLGRAHFLVEGVIHTVHDTDTQYQAWTRVKHVPQSHVVAVLDGTWRGLVRWRRVGTGSYPLTTVPSSAASSPTPSHTPLSVGTSSTLSSAATSRIDITSSGLGGAGLGGESEWTPLMDLQTLQVVPKIVRPLEKQSERESRKLWYNVTDNLIKKEFADATREKVVIEQRQRDETAERKRKGLEFVPRYFEQDLSNGWSLLTEEGRKAVEDELDEPSAYTTRSKAA